MNVETKKRRSQGEEPGGGAKRRSQGEEPWGGARDRVYTSVFLTGRP